MTDKTKLLRRDLAQIKKYVPGRPAESVQRELGVTEIVKLASNENPLGPSPKAVEAMRLALDEAHIYPDGGCFALADKLAAKLGIDPDCIVFGNGAGYLINTISKAFLNDGEEMIVADPSFAGFEIAAKLAGGSTVKVPVKDDFTTDVDAILGAVNDKTKLIILCTPNNPTGTMSTKDEVDRLLEQLPDHVVVVFDEAYKEFVDDPAYPESLDYLAAGHNVLISRTMSKIYGLAGIRLGYTLGHKDFISGIGRIRETFCTNRIAQIGGIAALDDDDFVERTKQLVRDGRNYFYSEFDRLGLAYVSSQANFVLVDTKRPVKELNRALLQEGIIVRPAHNWGLDTFLRVSVGTAEQNERFIRALKKVLS